MFKFKLKIFNCGKQHTKHYTLPTAHCTIHTTNGPHNLKTTVAFGRFCDNATISWKQDQQNEDLQENIDKLLILLGFTIKQPPGFENNHTFKCWSGIFPTILTYMIMLGNCQNNISLYGCSPIQGTKFYSRWNLMKPGSHYFCYLMNYIAHFFFTFRNLSFRVFFLLHQEGPKKP